MSATLREIDGDRAIEISTGRGEEHVFIEAGGHCLALDRAEFLAAIKAEFGLIDPLEALFEN